MLLEILIEELHNHLYLKCFYCDARWKAYTKGQSTRQPQSLPNPSTSISNPLVY